MTGDFLHAAGTRGLGSVLSEENSRFLDPLRQRSREARTGQRKESSWFLLTGLSLILVACGGSSQGGNGGAPVVPSAVSLSLSEQSDAGQKGDMLTNQKSSWSVNLATDRGTARNVGVFLTPPGEGATESQVTLSAPLDLTTTPTEIEIPTELIQEDGAYQIQVKTSAGVVLGEARTIRLDTVVSPATSLMIAGVEGLSVSRDLLQKFQVRGEPNAKVTVKVGAEGTILLEGELDEQGFLEQDLANAEVLTDGPNELSLEVEDVAGNKVEETLTLTLTRSVTMEAEFRLAEESNSGSQEDNLTNAGSDQTAGLVLTVSGVSAVTGAILRVTREGGESIADVEGIDLSAGQVNRIVVPNDRVSQEGRYTFELLEAENRLVGPLEIEVDRSVAATEIEIPGVADLRVERSALKTLDVRAEAGATVKLIVNPQDEQSRVEHVVTVNQEGRATIDLEAEGIVAQLQNGDNSLVIETTDVAGNVWVDDSKILSIVAPVLSITHTNPTSRAGEESKEGQTNRNLFEFDVQLDQGTFTGVQVFVTPPGGQEQLVIDGLDLSDQVTQVVIDEQREGQPRVIGEDGVYGIQLKTKDGVPIGEMTTVTLDTAVSPQTVITLEGSDVLVFGRDDPKALTVRGEANAKVELWNGDQKISEVILGADGTAMIDFAGVDITDLVDGDNSLRVVTTDLVGNDISTQMITLEIEASVPSAVTLMLAVDSNSGKTEDGITNAASVVVELSSVPGASDVRLFLSYENGQAQDLGLGSLNLIAGETPQTQTLQLESGDGAYTVQAMGSEGDVLGELRIVLDTQAPVIEGFGVSGRVRAGVYEGSTIKDQTLDLTVLGTQEGDEVEIFLGDVSLGRGSLGGEREGYPFVTIASVRGLGDGENRLTVVITDEAANEVRREVVVNVQSPVTLALEADSNSGDKNDLITNQRDLTFELSAEGVSSGVRLVLEGQLDDLTQTPIDLMGETVSQAVMLDDLPDGEYTLVARDAEDQDLGRLSWTLDTTAPELVSLMIEDQEREDLEITRSFPKRLVIEGERGARVAVWLGDTNLGELTLDDPGSAQTLGVGVLAFDFEALGVLQNGGNSLRIVIQDVVGNQREQTAELRVIPIDVKIELSDATNTGSKDDRITSRSEIDLELSSVSGSTQVVFRLSYENGDPVDLALGPLDILAGADPQIQRISLEQGDGVYRIQALSLANNAFLGESSFRLDTSVSPSTTLMVEGISDFSSRLGALMAFELTGEQGATVIVSLVDRDGLTSELGSVMLDQRSGEGRLVLDDQDRALFMDGVNTLRLSTEDLAGSMISSTVEWDVIPTPNVSLTLVGGTDTGNGLFPGSFGDLVTMNFSVAVKLESLAEDQIQDLTLQSVSPSGGIVSSPLFSIPRSDEIFIEFFGEQNAEDGLYKIQLVDQDGAVFSSLDVELDTTVADATLTFEGGTPLDPASPSTLETSIHLNNLRTVSISGGKNDLVNLYLLKDDQRISWREPVYLDEEGLATFELSAAFYAQVTPRDTAYLIEVISEDAAGNVGGTTDQGGRTVHRLKILPQEITATVDFRLDPSSDLGVSNQDGLTSVDTLRFLVTSDEDLMSLSIQQRIADGVSSVYRNIGVDVTVQAGETKGFSFAHPVPERASGSFEYRLFDHVNGLQIGDSIRVDIDRSTLAYSAFYIEGSLQGSPLTSTRDRIEYLIFEGGKEGVSIEIRTDDSQRLASGVFAADGTARLLVQQDVLSTLSTSPPELSNTLSILLNDEAGNTDSYTADLFISAEPVELSLASRSDSGERGDLITNNKNIVIPVDTDVPLDQVIVEITRLSGDDGASAPIQFVANLSGFVDELIVAPVNSELVDLRYGTTTPFTDGVYRVRLRMDPSGEQANSELINGASVDFTIDRTAPNLDDFAIMLNGFDGLMLFSDDVLSLSAVDRDAVEAFNVTSTEANLSGKILFHPRSDRLIELNVDISSNPSVRLDLNDTFREGLSEGVNYFQYVLTDPAGNDSISGEGILKIKTTQRGLLQLSPDSDTGVKGDDVTNAEQITVYAYSSENLIGTSLRYRTEVGGELMDLALTSTLTTEGVAVSGIVLGEDREYVLELIDSDGVTVLDSLTVTRDRTVLDDLMVQVQGSLAESPLSARRSEIEVLEVSGGDSYGELRIFLENDDGSRTRIGAQNANHVFDSNGRILIDITSDDQFHLTLGANKIVLQYTDPAGNVATEIEKTLQIEEDPVAAFVSQDEEIVQTVGVTFAQWDDGF